MKNKEIKIKYVNDVDIPAERGSDITNRGIGTLGVASRFRGSKSRLVSAMQSFEAIVDVNGHGDYINIQSALDAGKKSIFVRKGTYTITSAITILSSGVTIVGESWTNTIIKIGNGVNCNGIVVGNGTTAISDFSISDIQIDGNKANQTATSYGIYFYGASGYLITDSKIESCKAINCYSYAIHLCYSNNNTITGNQVTSNTDGIYLDSSHNNTISDNQANSNNNGIHLYYSNNNTITGNQANSNDEGIYLNSAYYNTITGNQANSNSNNGIYLYSAYYTTVIGNQANSNSHHHGICLYSADNTTVIGNQANSNGENGIHLYSSDTNTIVSNRCQINSSYGINVYDSDSTNNYVRLNYLTGNTAGSFNDAGTGTIKAADTTNDNVI